MRALALAVGATTAVLAVCYSAFPNPRPNGVRSSSRVQTPAAMAGVMPLPASKTGPDNALGGASPSAAHTESPLITTIRSQLDQTGVRGLQVDGLVALEELASRNEIPITELLRLISASEEPVHLRGILLLILARTHLDQTAGFRMVGNEDADALYEILARCCFTDRMRSEPPERFWRMMLTPYNGLPFVFFAANEDGPYGDANTDMSLAGPTGPSDLWLQHVISESVNATLTRDILSRIVSIGDGSMQGYVIDAVGGAGARDAEVRALLWSVFPRLHRDGQESVIRTLALSEDTNDLLLLQRAAQIGGDPEVRLCAVKALHRKAVGSDAAYARLQSLASENAGDPQVVEAARHALLDVEEDRTLTKRH